MDRDVWEVAIGQCLPCEQEGGNIHDPYAVMLEHYDMLFKGRPG